MFPMRATVALVCLALDTRSLPSGEEEEEEGGEPLGFMGEGGEPVPPLEGLGREVKKICMVEAPPPSPSTRVWGTAPEESDTSMMEGRSVKAYTSYILACECSRMRAQPSVCTRAGRRSLPSPLWGSGPHSR